MMMSELPGDLLEEILCRVPATSLKRLRSTCKQWNLLFNDMRFTRKHFHKAPKESLILKLKKFGFTSISIDLHKDLPVKFTGELNLINPCSSSDQYIISQYCYSSDGLLLCLSINARLVVWNPCTGQTKWIQHRKSGYNYSFALGSYQDKKSGNNSYKILSYSVYGDPEFEIYDINSNLWRILDVTEDCTYIYIGNVSLKGKTYWFAIDNKEKPRSLVLISFDYTTERFERQCLPSQCHGYRNVSLSLVREEKLSVLLQRVFTSKTEIWVTNKIGYETKVLSWIKVLAVDHLKVELSFGVKFLVDEEKKLFVFTQYAKQNGKNMVYIVGEDIEVREVALGDEYRPSLFNYVPSLTQI